MKKGLTRFADMTSEEFTVNAATYKTPLLTVEGKKERKLELDADVKRGERTAAVAEGTVLDATRE